MPGYTVEKGYGKDHKRLRAEYARRMKAGEQFDCWRCGKWIDSAADWDLGHDDYDRSIYRGPEHVYCNRSNFRPTPAQLKSKRWSGPVRNCEICGVKYRPHALKQRTCGPACGAKLNGRNRNPSPKAPRASGTRRQSAQMKACKVCGALSTRTICGAECTRIRARNRYRERVGIATDAPLWSRAN